MQAGGKHIQIVMPLTILNSVCITKLEIFDMNENGLETSKMVEVHTCPKVMPGSHLFDGEGFVLEDPNMKIDIKQIPDGKWNFKLECQGAGISMDVNFGLHDSITWAQPLSEDKQKYFFTHKTLAIPIIGKVMFD